MSGDHNREMTTDRDRIREWADRHDAEPVLTGEEGAVVEPVGFRFSDSDEGDSIEWGEFFDRFEDEGLALAYVPDSDDSTHRLVERRQGEETSDEESEGEQVRRAARREAKEDRQRADEPRDKARESDAAAQENVDAHRDEEPFNS